MAMGREPRPSIAYALFADARLRDGQPESVIDVLKPAYDRTPDDDEIGERLAKAYLMTGQFGEALPMLDGYLSRNPADQEALFAAVYSYYQHTTRELLALSADDQARVTRYVRAYQGPQQALLEKYLASMRDR
jgi:predicted Zn-dependent protease